MIYRFSPPLDKGGWYVIQVDHNNRRFDWYLDYVLDFQMLGVG
jgi:hypothetical protein